jgi:hypothetical protein
MGDVPFGNRMVLVSSCSLSPLRVRRVSHEAQTGGTPRDVEAALCPAGRADGEPVVGRFAPFEQHERVSKTDPLAAFEN